MNAGSKSSRRRTATHCSRTPSVAAASSVARQAACLPGKSGFHSTVMCETRGAISFTRPSRFPHVSAVTSAVRPVMFPPGRARLATKPGIDAIRHDDWDP
jgi:hypothetical protein